jgi:hypothetical protein
MLLKTIMLFVIGLLLVGCYYDNEEELFIPIPGTGGGSCDSTVVMYSTTIAPIMTSYCTRCHRAGRTDGGVNVDGYAQVLTYVNNGGLLGSIRHDNGFNPMPTSGSKIPACDIQKITAWIDGGAPNN